MYTALDKATVAELLQALPMWSGDEHEIRTRIEFDDFRGAMQFMQACMEGIEQRNHHPVWTNKFNVIDVRLSTFDIGNLVTRKDIDLAQFMTSMLAQYGRQFGHVTP